MDFGDRSQFAVELELDANCDDTWLFGRICYWIAGTMIGDYDVGTSLRDVLFQMAYVTGDSGKRVCPKLFCLNKEKIFALISHVLRGESEEIYRYIPPNFLPARLDVRIPVDVFDFWSIFLVESEVDAKLLYRKIESLEIAETRLTKGYFDKVVAEVHTYLERAYNKTAAQDGRT
jgi:hypothetical protein